MKKFSMTIVTLILLISSINAYSNLIVSAKGNNETHPADSMWIEPSIVDATGMSVGDKFNVTVWLNVTIEVGAWQFYLTYNKNYLNITGYGLTGTGGAKSQFFEQSGTQTWGMLSTEGSHNSTHDYLQIAESWKSGPFATGYGSLAWIEFQITAEPPPTLTLDIATAYPTDTYIMDPQMSKPPLNVYNSLITFAVVAIHDIAVYNVTLEPDEVFAGELVKIHVELINYGTQNETFTIKIYYNETLLWQKVDWIRAVSNKAIDYYWNTAGVSPGTYIITVIAEIPEDANPENNMFTDVILKIKAPVKEPPVAYFTYSPYSPTVNELITFDASESYDPDGGAIVDYIWDFGDGEMAHGKVVTHSYKSEGTYYVTLTVIDDEGDSDSLVKPLTVSPAVPPPELKVEIVLEPSCSKGVYPEWKNFTIHNVEVGRITKIDITHPPGFEASKYITPPGWEVNYNVEDRLITIRARDPCTGIYQGECETFRILFNTGPSEEGKYTFWVTVSNPEIGYSETQKVDECIDKTPPEVEIIYPKDGQVIKGCFWINATAFDEGLYPCGIDRVELYIDGEFYDYMIYDPERQVYYLRICALEEAERWYNVQAKAYDKAYPGGNFAWSNTVRFFWFSETQIEVYNKLIYEVYGEKVAYGHVCSEIVVRGITGFRPNCTVEIYFDDQKLSEAITDEHGRFQITVDVPECPRGTHIIAATDGVYSTSAEFEVYPWMFNNGEGYVGDMFTVEGKGFAADVEVLIYYRDVATCEIHWDAWAREWWNETDYMEWSPILGDIIVAKVRTNENGSFTAVFTVPESYGGLHPIYGMEKVSGIRSGYPPDGLWPEGLNQCVTFHVKTKIWVTPNIGVAEQYVTLHATGLPIPYGYNLIINGEYIYYDRKWSIALNFGPHKYWVWEHNYVLNNEIDMGWLAGVRYPIYYYDACPCCSRVWNGTLCWADIDLNLHEGMPFLKVPNLMAGDYIIKLYFFDEGGLQDVYDYGDEETFTIMKDPLMVRVEVGGVHFPDEIVTAIIKTNVDGVSADISEMTVKLLHETEVMATLEWLKIDKGLYYVSFECPSNPGIYVIIVSAAKHYDSFTLYAEGTANFIVSPTLGDIDARLQSIENGIMSINTTVGIINFRIEDLKAWIEHIDETVVTIGTDIGTIKANVEDIIEEIEVIGNNAVDIKTKLGTIEGKISSIDGKIATISTDVGTIKTDVKNISGLKENLSGYGSMQTVSVAFSIIAAFAAIIVVAIVLRRGYKK